MIDFLLKSVGFLFLIQISAIIMASIKLSWKKAYLIQIAVVAVFFAICKIASDELSANGGWGGLAYGGLGAVMVLIIPTSTVVHLVSYVRKNSENKILSGICFTLIVIVDIILVLCVIRVFSLFG